MRNIPTILIAVLIMVSAVFSASSVAYTSDATGAAIAPSSGGSGYLGGSAISTGSADGTKSPPSGYLGGPAPSPCSIADSVSCGGIAPPTPIVSCSNIASDAAVSKCIKSTIQIGTIGAPAIDRATQQKRPTSSTACVLSPNPLSVPVNTKSSVSISCFTVDGEIACPDITWSATIGTISGSSSGAGYKSSSTPGSGTISAAGIGADGVAFSCADSVTVSSPVSAATSCALAPAALTIQKNQYAEFTLWCFDASGNHVDCPDMVWGATIGTVTADPSIGGASYDSGSTTGTGAVSASAATGASDFQCSAPVAVISAPSAATSCTLDPSSLTIGVNEHQTFIASCSDIAGNEVSCPIMSWTSTIGTATPTDDTYSADFVSATSGSGIVRATGSTPKSGAVGTFFCQSDVTVTSTPTIIFSCQLTPSSLTIGVNGQQEFTVACYDRAGSEVPCSSDLSWFTDVGTLAPNPDGTNSMIFTAQATNGTGRVTAGGSSISPGAKTAPTHYSCTAPVTVTVATQPIRSCSIAPSSLTIQTSGQQVFAVTCYGMDGSVVRCSSDLSWGTNVGTLSLGPTKAQSVLFTAQSTPGSGSISAGGSNGAANAPTHYSCSAPINVVAVPPAASGCMLSPSSLTISINQTQLFTALCYSVDGTNVSCPTIMWAATIGSIMTPGPVSNPAIFMAGDKPGTGTVTASAVTGASDFQCSAPVTVFKPGTGTVASITVSPSSASLYTGQTQQFTAMAFDASGNFLRNLTSSEVAWSLDNPPIGTVDSNGLFRAVGVGATNLTATYTAITPGAKIEGKALISVSSTPPESGGGNGGVGGSGGSGGGSFRTSTTASISCAGRGGSIAITYYDSKAPSATVDVFYKTGGVEKVFSQTVSGTTTLSFTPPKEGLYELHITLGTEQTTADFSVPSCTPATINVTQNVTVQLQPVRELLLKRSIDYKGGLSKEFRVYKITDGESVDYQTEVDLLYAYSGAGTLSNFTIKDSVPRSVVSFSNQVSFQTYPTAMSTDQGVGFEWHVASVKSGQQLKFSYSMERLLTQQMIDSFAAPTLMTSQEREALITAQQGTGSNLLASMIGIGGFAIQLSLLLIILGVILVAALLYTFIFGKKKEE